MNKSLSYPQQFTQVASLCERVDWLFPIYTPLVDTSLNQPCTVALTVIGDFNVHLRFSVKLS